MAPTSDVSCFIITTWLASETKRKLHTRFSFSRGHNAISYMEGGRLLLWSTVSGLACNRTVDFCFIVCSLFLYILRWLSRNSLKFFRKAQLSCSDELTNRSTMMALRHFCLIFLSFWRHRSVSNLEGYIYSWYICFSVKAKTQDQDIDNNEWAMRVGTGRSCVRCGVHDAAERCPRRAWARLSCLVPRGVEARTRLLRCISGLDATAGW